MSTMEVIDKGKKTSYTLTDNKSDVLRRVVNLDTGEITYTMGKQIQTKTLKYDTPLYWEVITVARRLVGYVI